MPRKKILKSRADQKFLKKIGNALVYLDLKWSVLLHLFSSEENLNVLNKTAPSFFQIVQELLISDVVMGIGRLMDSAKMRKQDNLSMEGLSECIASPDLKKAVDIIIEEGDSRWRKPSLWRHKKFAHNDRQKALSRAKFAALDLDNLDQFFRYLCKRLINLEVQGKSHSSEEWRISPEEPLIFCDI